MQHKYNKNTQTIRYVIRKTFQAGIDNTHGQFYAPFNLIYLKTTLNFSESHKPRKIASKKKKIGYNSVYDLHLSFICYDLDDTLTQNNPFSSYN